MRASAVNFTVKGERVAASFHLPSGSGKFPAVLLCHGLTGDRVEDHFIFVKLSRALARKGIASLRFDFRGSGESEGAFSRMTIPEEIIDARAALKVLLRMPKVDRNRIGVLGLSMGAVVASNLSACRKDVKSLVLWSPVSKPSVLFKAVLRSTRPAGAGLRAWGTFLFGEKFFKDRRSMDPVKALTGCRRPFPALIINGTLDKAVPPSEVNRYVHGLKESRHPLKHILIPGADHTFSSLRTEQLAISSTVSWFLFTLAGGKR